MGVDDGARRIVGRREGGAAGEAEPADPQQGGADHGQHGGVGQYGLVRKTFARADQRRRDQRGDACGGVDHQSACKVHGPEGAGEPAAAPYPVRNRGVDDQAPRGAEQHDPAKACTLSPRADHQRCGEDREAHLEQHEGAFGHGGAVAHIGQFDQHPRTAIAEPAIADIAEGQRVAGHHPQDRDHRRDSAALQRDRQYVFCPHPSAVEQREAGQRHQQDERGGDKDPRGVAGIAFHQSARVLCEGRAGEQHGQQHGGNESGHRGGVSSKSARKCRQTAAGAKPYSPAFAHNW